MTGIAARPIARWDQLVQTENGEGLIIYDLDRQGLHALEPEAARIWRACDGTRTIPDLVAETRVPTAAVEAIMLMLAEASLLQETTVQEAPNRRSRRSLLKSAGIGAAVISVSAPAAAQAQSTCVPFNQCSRNSWGSTCCGTGLICALDMRDAWYACFAPVFCDDPDFWQVACWPA